MHITSDTLNALLIALFCSFAPSVLFILAWLGGLVRAQERRVETEQRASERMRHGGAQ